MSYFASQMTTGMCMLKPFAWNSFEGTGSKHACFPG